MLTLQLNKPNAMPTFLYNAIHDVSHKWNTSTGEVVFEKQEDYDFAISILNAGVGGHVAPVKENPVKIDKPVKKKLF